MSDPLEGFRGFIEELKASSELDPAEIADIENFLVEKLAEEPADEKPQAEPVVVEEVAEVMEERHLDIRTRIGHMPLSERIKTAMFGDRTCRALLVSDPNRLVNQAVLKNPKIALPEIEDFAGNKNISDGILRTIAEKDAWTQSYKVRLGLVTNPRTPIAISLKWLRYLQMGDVKKLARSKNVPQVIVTGARKRLDEDKKH